MRCLIFDFSKRSDAALLRHDPTKTAQNKACGCVISIGPHLQQRAFVGQPLAYGIAGLREHYALPVDHPWLGP